MKKLKLWAGLTALFVSGVLLGALGTWHLVEYKAIELMTRERPRAPKLIMRKLNRELGLNDAQKARIEAIVCQAFEALSTIRDRERPERERVLQQSIDAMKQELSPEQQRKLDGLYEKLKAHRERGSRRHWGKGDQGDPCEGGEGRPSQ